MVHVAACKSTTRSRRRVRSAIQIDVFARRQDAERFIEEIRGDEPELAKPFRIEERELEAGGRNWRRERVAKLAAGLPRPQPGDVEGSG